MTCFMILVGLAAFLFICLVALWIIKAFIPSADTIGQILAVLTPRWLLDKLYPPEPAEPAEPKEEPFWVTVLWIVGTAIATLLLCWGFLKLGL